MKFNLRLLASHQHILPCWHVNCLPFCFLYQEICNASVSLVACNPSLSSYLLPAAQLELGEQDPGFTQTQLAQVDLSSTLAEERDQEIRKIVESITELAEVSAWVGRQVGMDILNKTLRICKEG